MIINGDSIEVLKSLEDNSVDTVITDPPYGYSFMGKDWDKAVPSVEIWQECLRVLKPGAFACVMSAPRSDVQNAMISRLMEAGFRLDFTPIYWTYATGFPKAGNIGKLVDKRLGTYVEGKPTANARFHSGGDDGNYNHAKITREFNAQSDQGKALDGSYAGFQPKPAVEVVIIAMKPLSEKTYVDQALKNGKGITWLDDARIPTSNNDKAQMMGRSGKPTKGQTYDPHNSEQEKDWNPNAFIHDAGRFPANLLVSDDVLTEDYSRFFTLDAWARERLPAEQAMTFPFLAVPKASKSEKNRGLPEGLKASHPTVKPLKLMSYLITLFSREGDTVLDPFVGSGTTAVAAEQLGRKGIGVEREAEYAEIARARVEHAKAEDDRNKQIQLIE